MVMVTVASALEIWICFYFGLYPQLANRRWRTLSKTAIDVIRFVISVTFMAERKTTV